MKLKYYCLNVDKFGNIYFINYNGALVFLHTEMQALISYASILKAELIEDYDANVEIITQLNEYFKGKRKQFTLKTEYLSGTDFQKKVWQELCKVSFGKTLSYKDIAARIQYPKAIRAVGTAIGKNPIPVIIPCHRIINSNGKLGGFSLGLDKKRFLLALEKI